MLFLKFFCRSFVLAAFVLTAVVTLSGCPDATSPQTRVDSVIINSPGFVFRGGDFQLSAQVLGVNVTNTVRWYLDMEDENYNSAYSEAAHAPVEDISLPAFAEDMGFDIRAFAEALSDQQITRSRITPDGLLQVARYDGVDDEVPEYIWVRAVSTQNPAVEGRYKVRINSPGFTINGIRPYPYSSAREPQVIFAGSSQQFSFTLDADPYWYAPKDVRWYLIHSNTKNPATQLQQGPGGEVTLVTYDNYEVPHTVVIQVRSLGDRRVRGWAFVEIVPSIVQDITITPPADLPALRGAITQPFSAEVTGIGTPSQAVTWSISSNTIFGTALVPVTGTHKVKLAVAQRESYENSPLRLRATSVQDPAVFAEIDVPVEGERLVGQWRQVSVGNDHVLAIDWNHQVWSWGRNTAGQVGVGNRISPVQNPTLVTPPGIKFRAVAAGLSHSFAIQYDPGGSDDFRLWSWGSGQYGKLGHAAGHTSDILTPTPIQFALQFGWDTISAGRDHSAGIKTNTTLYTWGRARVTFTGGSAYVLGQGSTNVDARIPTRRFRDDP
ncbi:MAG: hypothetical protein LBG93_06555, partial [Treponema sp.]|nr:hypothetical protein [Treponema sp.]